MSSGGLTSNTFSWESPKTPPKKRHNRQNPATGSDPFSSEPESSPHFGHAPDYYPLSQPPAFFEVKSSTSNSDLPTRTSQKRHFTLENTGTGSPRPAKRRSIQVVAQGVESKSKGGLEGEDLDVGQEILRVLLEIKRDLTHIIQSLDQSKN
jgi:hypothetical protein